MSASLSFPTLVSAAASALKERAEEVNRLNVFPVPDGDTGTNMALTMDAVVAELTQLPANTDIATYCQGVTHASLMGARGNSGVILSQILRGVCEVVANSSADPSETIAAALERATAVAFQAVRKPVEGTMLTVLKDAGIAARAAVDEGAELDDVIDSTLQATVDSVRRTPELLPVLKENGVVDAGGFGLAILAEGLVAAVRGTDIDEDLLESMDSGAVPALSVIPEDDWDDDEYLYCTEFLLIGEDLDRGAIEQFVGEMGGSELVVGEESTLKIHVHTNDPGAVISHMTVRGEVAEVHINNMRQQTEARAESLRAEGPEERSPAKPVGFVAVGVGEGIKEILTSLGVDFVVNGGQTMNPSTAELLEAVEAVPAEAVVVLPNNKNIQMAAQQLPDVSERPVAVIPTTSVPEAFAALLAFDPETPFDEVSEQMTAAAATVKTGEVTTAIKDSTWKEGAITEGQVIGIADHEIEVVGDDVVAVAIELAGLLAPEGDTMTILGGEELDPDELERLADELARRHPELEVEHHVGGQPLYPVVLSVE